MCLSTFSIQSPRSSDRGVIIPVKFSKHNQFISVACPYYLVDSSLAKEGFSISLDVQLDNNNAVYFFVKDRPAHSVKRLKSVKLKHGARVLSLRRKVVTKQISGRRNKRTKNNKYFCVFS